jgi:hypothetical protein
MCITGAEIIHQLLFSVFPAMPIFGSRAPTNTKGSNSCPEPGSRYIPTDKLHQETDCSLENKVTEEMNQRVMATTSEAKKLVRYIEYGYICCMPNCQTYTGFPNQGKCHRCQHQIFISCGSCRKVAVFPPRSNPYELMDVNPELSPGRSEWDSMSYVCLNTGCKFLKKCVCRNNVVRDWRMIMPC